MEHLQHAFDDVARDHERYTRLHPLKRLFYQSLIKAFLQACAPGPGEKIVDLACAQGFYGSLCRKRGAQVYFLDINHMMLECLNANILPADRGRSVQGDIRMLPFGDHSFDKTICLGAFPPLANLAEVERTIKECVRITKPGGLVILTYNPPHLLRDLSVKYYRLTARFSLASLKDLPFISGQTDGMQPHEDMRGMLDRLGRPYSVQKVATGVFALVRLKC